MRLISELASASIEPPHPRDPHTIQVALEHEANPAAPVHLYSQGVRLASTSSLYVYSLSPPTCESQYVVGSVKNSPCLQRGRIASSRILMPRPGPVGTGM